MGTRKNATNWVVREELGMMPIESYIKTQTVSYLGRLNNDKLNPLLREAYELTKILDNEGIYTWFTYAKNVVKESNNDLNKITGCKNLKEVKRLKNEIKSNVIKYYKSLNAKKLEKLNYDNKNFLYKHINTCSNDKYYLAHPNKITRQKISKFRVSDHDLLIETGRYKKIPREERVCSVCKMLDDEVHFFFHCKINEKFRVSLYKYYNEKYSIDPTTKGDLENLVLILNPSTPDDIKTVVSFINQSLELRTGDL